MLSVVVVANDKFCQISVSMLKSDPLEIEEHDFNHSADGVLCAAGIDPRSSDFIPLRFEQRDTIRRKKSLLLSVVDYYDIYGPLFDEALPVRGDGTFQLELKVAVD